MARDNLLGYLGTAVFVFSVTVATMNTSPDEPNYTTLLSHECVDTGRMADDFALHVWQCKDGFRVTK